MQTYFASLEDITQHTMQLQNVPCGHCGKVAQLVSHGFVYKDQPFRTDPAPIGKRVFCSNRYGRTGCGKTVRLYLDTVIRHLHFSGGVVVAFFLAMISGATIASAYTQVTGTEEARNAWRWINKFMVRIAHFRSLFVLASADEIAPCCSPPSSLHRELLARTFTLLTSRLSQPLCAAYQLLCQTSFI